MSSFLTHIVILWVVIAVVIVAMVILRRAGRISKKNDWGVDYFVGAAFGTILAFTTFFATQQYQSVQEAAESEANQLGVAAAMAGSFPPKERDALRRTQYCYATAVINYEWPEMEEGNRDGAPQVDARIAAGYLQMLRIGRMDTKPANWYGQALNSIITTGEQRQERLLLAAPQVPTELWVLIYLGSAITLILLYLGLLKDDPVPEDEADSGSTESSGAEPKSGDGVAALAGESPSRLEQLRAGRRERVWALAGTIVMLSAIVGVLAGLDDSVGPPLGVEPDAMENEQRLLSDFTGQTPETAEAYCREVPALGTMSAVPRQFRAPNARADLPVTVAKPGGTGRYQPDLASRTYGASTR